MRQSTQKKTKKKKKTAVVVCQNGTQFWTTQNQFWQWVREGVLSKTGDWPLTGTLNREHAEVDVVIKNTILNLACPNHLREALAARRLGVAGK